jgi:5,10-methylene-tetrahydrofolate dehydrogenase/methenyl tetrahydrofolate cyclohydrolase
VARCNLSALSSRTRGHSVHVARVDIVVAAASKAGPVSAEWITPGRLVIELV